MPASREAVDTIRGYYYQFDFFLLQILEQEDENIKVTVEGIEDVDIEQEDNILAIQCKYYEGTEYNHSVIAPAIRLMLKDYETRKKDNQFIKYKLYGKYQGGCDKLPASLTVEFIKKKFFTYTTNGVKHKLYEELALTDDELEMFLKNLEINIMAPDFKEQEKKVLRALKSACNCNEFDAENFYYPRALGIVRELASQKQIEGRNVSKKEFLTLVDNKMALFDKWYFKYKGIDAYCKKIRQQYFTKGNISPFERIFTIEFNEKVTIDQWINLINKISSNWSKLSKRDPNTFCPYIYIHNVPCEVLKAIKLQLIQNKIKFIDGYEFYGADFNVEAILQQATYRNEVKVKIISKLEELESTIKHNDRIVQLYQFYIYNKINISAGALQNNRVTIYEIPINNIMNIEKII